MCIRDRYDGYHFGDFDVYCPWDVMNYMLELQHNPKAKPISYWKNTSDNAIIRSFIDYAGSTITKKLETLMAGGCICLLYTSRAQIYLCNQPGVQQQQPDHFP